MAPAPSPSASRRAVRRRIPTGWTEHDIAARDEVRRYIGNLAPALKGIYGDAIVRQARRHARRRPTTTPSSARSRRSPRSRSSSSTTPSKPLKPELDGDVKVFRLTIDEIEQQIDELMPPVAGARLQRPVAGPDDPRQPGRQGPRDLHQQPEGDDRRPLPRRRVRRLLPGRRPVRDPEADRPRRDVRLRVHGQSTPAR